MSWTDKTTESARFKAMLETIKAKRDYRMKTIDEIIQTLESDAKLRIDDAINILDSLDDLRDPEVGHDLADRILCKLLKDRGCGDVVMAYEGICKWYA